MGINPVVMYIWWVGGWGGWGAGELHMNQRLVLWFTQLRQSLEPDCEGLDCIVHWRSQTIFSSPTVISLFSNSKSGWWGPLTAVSGADENQEAKHDKSRGKKKRTLIVYLHPFQFTWWRRIQVNQHRPETRRHGDSVHQPRCKLVNLYFFHNWRQTTAPLSCFCSHHS